MLSDLPIEVGLLFGALIFVGIAGLVKQSGVLSADAPTVGLGDSRDDLVEAAREKAAEAAASQEVDISELSQAEKERKYFSVLAEEQAQKRGGSKSKRKKGKRKK